MSSPRPAGPLRREPAPLRAAWTGRVARIALVALAACADEEAAEPPVAGGGVIDNPAALVEALRRGEATLEGLSPAPRLGGALLVQGAEGVTPTLDLVASSEPAGFAAGVFSGRERLALDSLLDLRPSSGLLLRAHVPAGLAAVGAPTSVPVGFEPEQALVQLRVAPGLEGPALLAEGGLLVLERYERAAGGAVAVASGRIELAGRLFVQRPEGGFSPEPGREVAVTVRFRAPIVAAAAVALPARAVGEGIELLHQLRPPGDGLFSDVAAGPDYAALGSLAGGGAPSGWLVDLADEARPALIPLGAHGAALDLVAAGDRLFLAVDQRPEGGGAPEGGVAIYDVSARRAPRLVTLFSSETVRPGVHDLFVDGDRLYAACFFSCADRGVHVLDVSDPAHPRELGALVPAPAAGGRAAHDLTVLGGRAYVADWEGGWAVYDVSGPGLPAAPLLAFSHEGANAHSIWPTADGRFALTGDEYVGGALRIWDLEAPAGPIEVGRFAPRPSSTVHNVVVVGQTAFVSWYQLGLQVVDLSEPARPTAIARWDSYVGRGDVPLAASLFLGAWGVAADERRVYVSDMQGGLLIFRNPTGSAP